MAIKKKSNGKYLVDVRNEFGIRMERTFKKKAEADAFKAMHTSKKYENLLISAKLQNKRFIITEELSHFERTKQDLRPGSIKRYKYIISQINDFMSAIEIIYVDQFTPDHATLFKEVLMRERIDPKKSTTRILKAKPKTVNFFLMTLKAFFQQEYIKGHISRNPMVHIKNLRVDKKKPDYYTVPELKAFFSQEMHTAYRQAFMGLLLTGTRFSELAHLKWVDVNLSEMTIHIHPQDDFNTKTHNAERLIPIGGDLFMLLQGMRKDQKNLTYVFRSPKGGILRERSLLGKCKSIASDAKIKSVATLHKFRHTYATMLILRGVPIQNIKELLGHASIVQTEIYAHNKPDHLHPDVKLLDNLLKS